jgi:hypothetical protein
MHVVIFEVEPTEDGRASYLEIAGQLRAELETIDGFIAIERFESLVTPGKVLSLSTLARRGLDHPLARAHGPPGGAGAGPLRLVQALSDPGRRSGPGLRSGKLALAVGCLK